MSAATTWRLLDTGLRPAAENIALNRAMLAAHQAEEIPHTLRFLRFEPAALVGYHQVAEEELRLEYCRRHRIAVQRRITGGGAIYFDSCHLGWELYLDRRSVGGAGMEAIAGRICRAAARGLSRLGIDARFRPRNDIEVDGRKISGTGGAFDGGSLMYQGTLLLELDPERMLRVLRVPAEKLTDKAIDDVRERVTDLRTLLGEVPPVEQVKAVMVGAFAKEFGVEIIPVPQLTPAEEHHYQEALAEIDSDDWVFPERISPAPSARRVATRRTRGGLMRAALLVDEPAGRIRQLWITGDFFVNPPRMVPDLEAALKDLPLTDVADAIHGFFRAYPVEMLMLSPDDFVALIQDATAPAR